MYTFVVESLHTCQLLSNFQQNSCIAEPGLHSPLHGSCSPVSAMQLLCTCTCMCTLYIALQNDILDINDIFRDLGTMVHDQGELVGE